MLRKSDSFFSVFVLSLTATATAATPITVPGVSAGFTVTQVAPRTFVASAYSNMVIYDVGGGLVLVDSMSPAFLGGNDLADIRTTLAALKDTGKISSTDIKLIANTHWHPDHIGNNDTLGAGKPVVSGRGGKFRVTNPQNIAYFGAQLPAWPTAFAPTQEIARKLELEGGKVVMRYAPYSHTTTDLVVILPEEKVAVLGDLILQGWLAFTDNHNGGTMRGLVLTVERTLDRIPDDFTIVPGHNRVMTKSEARQWIRAIRSGIVYVDRLIEAGKTLDQIRAKAALPTDQGGLPAELKSLDGSLFPVAAFIGFVHDDLTLLHLRALLAARKLAKVESVSKADLRRAVRTASAGLKDAAGKAFDTLAFQVYELQAIGGILNPEATQAFDTYAAFVEGIRANGRVDLTRAEFAALMKSLK